jgi:hypothetical protein
MLLPRKGSEGLDYLSDTAKCIGTHMDGHIKLGWPSVQKAWCDRVHREQKLGTKHTKRQMQSLLTTTAVDLHVPVFNPQRNWFYQVLKRHHLDNKLSEEKRAKSPSANT